MQDAFGGIMNLLFIALFFVIIEGVLGLTFSYTKAFKMKNIVISSIEEYENACCVDPSNDRSACRTRMKERAKTIGYAPSNLVCPRGFDNIDNLFCVNGNIDSKNGKKYRIITQVDINLIIIRDIMPKSFLQVTGDTRSIYTKGSAGSCGTR